MKLPASLVASFQAVQQNFDAIAGGVPAMDWGVAILHFAGSTGADETIVSHRLGRAPIAILVTALNAPAYGQIVTPNAYSSDRSTFRLNGEMGTAITGSVAVSWLALA